MKENDKNVAPQYSSISNYILLIFTTCGLLFISCKKEDHRPVNIEQRLSRFQILSYNNAGGGD